MQDVSATGVKITIIAVPTFPQGFEISEFADDADWGFGYLDKARSVGGYFKCNPQHRRGPKPRYLV